MKINLRADNTAEITGYVNAVGRESRLLGDFYEVVEPKVFERALKNTNCVGLMFNHVRLLGSTNDCLELKEDNIGLYARAIVNDPEVIAKAQNDKLQGWSFGFYINDQEVTTRADGTELHTLKDIDLVEVSILDCTPAYIATSIEMRDGENVQTKTKNVRVFEDTVEKVIDVPSDLSDLEQKKRYFNFILL